MMHPAILSGSGSGAAATPAAKTAPVMRYQGGADFNLLLDAPATLPDILPEAFPEVPEGEMLLSPTGTAEQVEPQNVHIAEGAEFFSGSGECDPAASDRSDQRERVTVVSLTERTQFEAALRRAPSLQRAGHDEGDGPEPLGRKAIVPAMVMSPSAWLDPDIDPEKVAASPSGEQAINSFAPVEKYSLKEANPADRVIGAAGHGVARAAIEQAFVPQTGMAADPSPLGQATKVLLNGPQNLTEPLKAAVDLTAPPQMASAEVVFPPPVGTNAYPVSATAALRHVVIQLASSGASEDVSGELVTMASSSPVSMAPTAALLVQDHQGGPRQLPPLPPPPGAQVLTVLREMAEGQTELSLDPVELGRVRIVLRVEGDRAHVHMYAERPETLDVLRRSSAELTAGLEADGYETSQFLFSRDERPQKGEETDEAEHFHIIPLQEQPRNSQASAERLGLDLRF